MHDWVIQDGAIEAVRPYTFFRAWTSWSRGSSCNIQKSTSVTICAATHGEEGERAYKRRGEEDVKSTKGIAREEGREKQRGEMDGEGEKWML